MFSAPFFVPVKTFISLGYFFSVRLFLNSSISFWEKVRIIFREKIRIVFHKRLYIDILIVVLGEVRML